MVPLPNLASRDPGLGPPICRPYVALCSLIRTRGANMAPCATHHNPSTPACAHLPHAACVKRGLVTRCMALWIRLPPWVAISDWMSPGAEPHGMPHR